MYRRKRPLRQPVIVALILASVLFLAACGVEVEGQNWPGLAAQGDRVYAAYGVGVAAVDVEQRELLWTFPEELNPALPFYAAPSVNEERIVIGDYGASGGMFSPQATVTLYALENSENASSPSLIWSRDDVAHDRVVASPEQTGSQIFIGTADNHLYAVDVDDGSVQWEFETGHSIWAQPIYNEGVVYLASLDNSVYALSADNGELLWQRELSGSVASNPLLHDGLLYVPSFDRKLHALHLDSGEEAWAADAQNWVWATPAVGNGTIFYADINGNVYAVDSETGEQRWTQQVLGSVQSRLLYVDGVLYVASGETEGDENERLGQLLAMDGETGDELWRRETNAPVFTAPVEVGDSVVIVVQDEERTLLQVYERENGALAWDLTLPSE